jgi:hypothetical protein
VASLPDVREPVAAADLLHALLEAVVDPGRVRVRGRHPQHLAEVDEMLLGRRPLGRRAAIHLRANSAGVIGMSAAPRS